MANRISSTISILLILTLGRNSPSIAEPLVQLIAHNQFQIGQLLNISCRLESFDPKDYYKFRVFVEFNSTTNQMFEIGGYEDSFDNNNPVFVPRIIESETGITAKSGNIAHFPTYELRIMPMNEKAIGTYRCAVKPMKLESTKNVPKYNSTFWSSSDGKSIGSSLSLIIIINLIIIIGNYYHFY